MKKQIASLLFIAAVVSTASAQKIKILDGSLAGLKGETKLNVVYDYSNMGVGSFAKEEEYVAKKTREYNA
ncbi:MAG TPA: hypothetical protein PKX86_07055, partial [Bacteroidia bacterium]|nr:hypothetical protein [Bacteroidia bacterium]